MSHHAIRGTEETTVPRQWRRGAKGHFQGLFQLSWTSLSGLWGGENWDKDERICLSKHIKWRIGHEEEKVLKITHVSLCPLNYHRFVQRLTRRIKGIDRRPAGSAIQSVTSANSIIFLFIAWLCIRTPEVVLRKKKIHFLLRRNIVCNGRNVC